MLLSTCTWSKNRAQAVAHLLGPRARATEKGGTISVSAGKVALFHQTAWGVN